MVLAEKTRWRTLLSRSWMWKSNQALSAFAGNKRGIWCMLSYTSNRFTLQIHSLFSLDLQRVCDVSFTTVRLDRCMIKLEMLIRPCGKAQWDNTCCHNKQQYSRSVARVFLFSRNLPCHELHKVAGCSWWDSAMTGNVSRDGCWCIPQAMH